MAGIFDPAIFDGNLNKMLFDTYVRSQAGGYKERGRGVRGRLAVRDKILLNKEALLLLLEFIKLKHGSADSDYVNELIKKGDIQNV